MLGKTIALVKGMEVVVEVNLYEVGESEFSRKRDQQPKPSARDSVLEEFVL